MKIKSVVFMDDYILNADSETTIEYTTSALLIQVFYKGILSELINIQVVRSMDVLPPTNEC